MSTVNVEEVLSSRELPIIDVRSPGEFQKGHISGARNVPLFDDAERAEIGVLYKHQGRDPAVRRGIEIASAKVDGLFDDIKAAAMGARFIVHCWRGGMRSRAVAWLCADCGLDPVVLEGGYKAFRREAHNCFAQPKQVILLAGPTGTGKTRLLQSLRDAGQQVIDLEGLAGHRGSVFGGVPGVRQPTVEQFENDLFLQWRTLDPFEPVWIEGESQRIGKVLIPRAIWQQMSQAPVVHVNANRGDRIDFLIDEYGDLPADELSAAAERIRKRLGGLRTQTALDAILREDWPAFCDTMLEYYDKYYAKALQKRPPQSVQRVDLGKPGDPGSVGELVAVARQLLDGTTRLVH